MLHAVTMLPPSRANQDALSAHRFGRINLRAGRLIGLFLAAFLLPQGSLLASTPGQAAIEEWRTSTGVSVRFVASPAIPLVDLAINIDAGGRWDPAGLEGLAELTADLSGRGLRAEPGKPALDETGFERAFGELAAQKSIQASEERVVLKARFLADPEVRDAVVGLLSRQLAHPAFDSAVFERERQRTVAGLKDDLTQPQTLAVRALFSAMYEGHPYGRPASLESLQRLNVEQVRAFHGRLWRPERLQVVLVGALTRVEAEVLVERLTRPLSETLVSSTIQQASKDWAFVLPAVPPTQASSIRLDHPASQSHIWLGLPILARQEQEDYFPLLVANHILGGGGFSSRLTQEVREKRGLSYSVFSALSPRAQTGPFMVGLQTQGSKRDEALKVVQETLAQFVKDGPTEAELEAAKKNLMGGFALRLDTNRKLLDALSDMSFYGLPANYLETWTASIEAVSRSDIQRVLGQRLRLDRMTTVVVGGNDRLGAQ